MTIVLAIFPILFTMFWDLMHSSICRATLHTLSQMSSEKTYLGKRSKDGLIDWLLVNSWNQIIFGLDENKIPNTFVIFIPINCISVLLQRCVSPKKSSSSSPNLPSLGNTKSHHHDSKPTRIQNSKLQCSMNNPCSECHVHPNHVIIIRPY
jgi:hypothetical protein